MPSPTGSGAGDGRFKTPSLRNVAVRGRFMHDGRFSTLEEVVQFYSSGVQDTPLLDPRLRDPVQLNLTQEQINDIVAFLNTLTDNSFLTNSIFSDPFVTLPGDYNGDGVVDSADYVVWRKYFGDTTLARRRRKQRPSRRQRRLHCLAAEPRENVARPGVRLAAAALPIRRSRSRPPVALAVLASFCDAHLPAPSIGGQVSSLTFTSWGSIQCAKNARCSLDRPSSFAICCLPSDSAQSVPPAAESKTRVFEIRTYTTEPGKLPIS